MATFNISDFEFNSDSFVIVYNDKYTSLTIQERTILTALLLQYNRQYLDDSDFSNCFPTDSLSPQLTPYEYRKTIKSLKRKLKKISGKEFIHSCIGEGYTFLCPDTDFVM